MLKSSWASQTGNSVLCISASCEGRQIAVGTADSCLVLDASSSGTPVFDSGPGQGPVTSIAFTTQGTFLTGSSGHLRLWDAREERTDALLSLDLRSESDDNTGVSGNVLLARLEESDTFAAASQSGRHIFIVSGELTVTCKLDLQQSKRYINQLLWLSEKAVLATVDGGLQAWAKLGADEPPTLLGQAHSLTKAACSPDGTLLATGSKEGVVHLWRLAGSFNNADLAEPQLELLRTLKDYGDEVCLLHWQPQGRYLLTADGGEANFWDISRLLDEPVESITCGGHGQNTCMSCAAFQRDGWKLATGGSDGRVLFYESMGLTPGESVRPCAVAQYLPAGDAVAAIAWLTGGTLVAGTSQGNIVGWQLEQSENSKAAVPDLAGPAPAVTVSAAADVAASMLDSMDISKDALQSTARATDAGAKSRAMFDAQRSGSIPERQGLPAPGRFPRSPGGSSRPTGRDSLSMAAPLERNASVPMRTSSREGMETSRNHLGRPESGLSILEASKSSSLQDNQSLGRRSGSFERQQLSPGLMQRIQQVQHRPAAQTRQREPAGWGMGSPSALSSPQMQFAAPGMMPYTVAPAQMPPGYMMVPNPAMMAGQQMMHGFGYPPGMAPMPMMAHGQVGQPGMVGPKGAMAQGLAPGMVYMPMAGMPQQQWPMMQAPWMGYQILPGPHPPSPEHLSLMAAGRSSSAPNGPLAFTRPGRPAQLSGSGGEARQSLTKNAISLPATVARDALRAEVERAAAMADTSAGEADKPPLGAARFKVSSNPDLVGLKNAKEREGAWTPPSEGLRPPQQFSDALDNGHLEDPDFGDSSGAVLTIYVGNLSNSVDEAALHAPFSWFGHITNIQVIRDKNSMQSRGFAFVSYAHPVFAANAINMMNGRSMPGEHFRGRTLKVGPSNRMD